MFLKLNKNPLQKKGRFRSVTSSKIAPSNDQFNSNWIRTLLGVQIVGIHTSKYITHNTCHKSDELTVRPKHNNE